METMQEWRIWWQCMPYRDHPRKVLFVKAPDESTARAVARDHIERTLGYGFFDFREVAKYTKPTGGVVIEGE